MFAKTFDTKHGQVVVLKQRNDDGDPEIRFYFHPQGFDVCSLGVGYRDDDAGWDSRDARFEEINREWAERVVGSAIQESGLSTDQSQ